MIFPDQDFSLSISYKAKEKNVFSDLKYLEYSIDKTTGRGDADDPCMFGITIRNHGHETWTGVVKVTLATALADTRFFCPGTCMEATMAIPVYSPGSSRNSSGSAKVR